MTKQLKEVNNKGYLLVVKFSLKNCYPPVHNTHVSNNRGNNGAEIELQAFLVKTFNVKTIVYHFPKY
jgi:hypothetical protein